MKEEMDSEMVNTAPSGPVKETKSELKSRWFTVFQRVTREHWENETEETKKAIADEIHAQREAEMAARKDGDDMEIEERTPEEYAE
jgi:hypothetical protein